MINVSVSDVDIILAIRTVACAWQQSALLRLRSPEKPEETTKNDVITGARDGGRFDSSVQKVEQPNKKFPRDCTAR